MSDSQTDIGKMGTASDYDCRVALKTINAAMFHLHQSDDVERQDDQCRCDPDVGDVPCAYCALFLALRRSHRVIEYYQQQDAARDRRERAMMRLLVDAAEHIVTSSGLGQTSLFRAVFNRAYFDGFGFNAEGAVKAAIQEEINEELNCEQDRRSE